MLQKCSIYYDSQIYSNNSETEYPLSPLLPSCVKGAIAQKEFLSVQNNKTKF